MPKVELKKVNVKDFSKVSGEGLSKGQCALLWSSCLHDAALGGLGTSNPVGNCGLYQKFCVK